MKYEIGDEVIRLYYSNCNRHWFFGIGEYWKIIDIKKYDETYMYEITRNNRITTTLEVEHLLCKTQEEAQEKIKLLNEKENKEKKYVKKQSFISRIKRYKNRVFKKYKQKYRFLKYKIVSILLYIFNYRTVKRWQKAAGLNKIKNNKKGE